MGGGTEPVDMHPFHLLNPHADFFGQATPQPKGGLASGSPALPPKPWLRLSARATNGSAWVSHAKCWACGCGSKLNTGGYAGVGPYFHLPGFHFGTVFLSQSHVTRDHRSYYCKKGVPKSWLQCLAFASSSSLMPP